MIPSDGTLLILKYAGTTFAAAYGVYATLTDFKEDKNGKKALTRKGRWGIALLLGSILVNISSDGFKDLKDRSEREFQKKRDEKAVADQRYISDALTKQIADTEQIYIQLEHARKELRQTEGTTSAALNAATRAADPFIPADINWFAVGYAIPNDQPLVQAYIQRIQREPYSNPEGKIIKPGPGTGLKFAPGSPGYPNHDLISESALAARVTVTDVFVRFTKKGVPLGGPSLTATLACGPETLISYSIPGTYNESSHGRLFLWCRGKKIYWEDWAGGFRSYQDFVDATANIEARGDFLDHDRVSVTYFVDSILMSTPTGREIQATHLGPCKTESRFAFSEATRCLATLGAN